MKILVLGSVAKEHALVKWISQSKHKSEIFAYPGNPGMCDIAKIICRDNNNDIQAVLDIIKNEKINLVISSTATLIEKGVMEEIKKLGCAILGPGKDAFAFENLQTLRERAKRYGIKTLDKAKVVTNENELDEALSLFKNRMVSLKTVIGKSKNRFDTMNMSIAKSWAMEYMKYSPILIEEFIEGLAATATVLTDSEHYRLFPIASDYYKSLDDDSGEFSSGMGSIAPLPISRYTRDRVGEEVIKKMVKGLKEDGIVYKGFLTFHILITASGDVVLLNMKTRLSDPSAPLMLSLTNDDAVEELQNAIDIKLVPEEFHTKEKTYALGIVIASKGYPSDDIKEVPVKLNEIPKSLQNVKNNDFLYYGAVKDNKGTLYTAGGRPFTLVVQAESIERANRKAYTLLYDLKDVFHGAWWREDIGANFFLF